jgi:hypothetical protein
MSEHKTLWKDACVGKHVDPLREASGRVADSAEVVNLAKRG